MTSLRRQGRLPLRLVAIGLVVVGAVLASSWFDMLLRGIVDSSSPVSTGSVSGSPEALEALVWAIPMLFVGLVLLLLTRKREQVLSLNRHPDDP